MIWRVRRVVSLMLATSTALAACSSGATTGREHQRWGGLVSDVRAQWSAAPGIDLSTGVAVPVRAYLESFELGQFTGNPDDLYPGFMHAVPPNEPEGPDPSARDRRPTLKHPNRSALVGNLRFHITSVQRSEQNFTVTLCQYNYGVAEQQVDGSYTSLVAGGRADSSGISAVRVFLMEPTGESDPVLPPQKGSAAAPVEDVFADWQITGQLTSSSSSSSAQWPTYQADDAACVEAAPDSLERRAFLLTGEHPRSDFPTSPPSPGWPSGRE